MAGVKIIAVQAGILLLAAVERVGGDAALTQLLCHARKGLFYVPVEKPQALGTGEGIRRRLAAAELYGDIALIVAALPCLNERCVLAHKAAAPLLLCALG